MKALKTIFVFVVMIFLGFSCGSNEKRPEGILDRDEMVRALTDVYIAEEKIRRLSITVDSGQQVFDRLQNKVLDKAGVKDTVLKQSIDYYMGRPKELAIIYTAMVDSLNLWEQRVSVQEQ